MNIQQKESESKGAFFIEKEGERIAEMTYSKGDDRIIINHTEVDKSMRGQGLGEQLIEHAVTYARNHNLKIVPRCRFAASVIDDNHAYHDVL